MRARVLIWIPALLVVIVSARYFLDPVPWLVPPLPDALTKLIRTPADFATLDIGPNMYRASPTPR